MNFLKGFSFYKFFYDDEKRSFKLNDYLIKGLSQLEYPPSDEQITLIEKFYELFVHWSFKINLSTIKEKSEFIIKHVLDSASALPFFPENPGRILDLGTGGGFPGIVLKIMNPEWKIDLVDVVLKKINYLKSIVKDLNLDINVYNASKEKIPDKYDIVVSRAFGSLEKTYKESRKYLKEKGRVFSYKGKKSKIIEEAKALKKFQIKPIELEVPFLDAERHLVIFRI